MFKVYIMIPVLIVVVLLFFKLIHQHYPVWSKKESSTVWQSAEGTKEKGPEKTKEGVREDSTHTDRGRMNTNLLDWSEWGRLRGTRYEKSLYVNKTTSNSVLLKLKVERRQ